GDAVNSRRMRYEVHVTFVAPLLAPLAFLSPDAAPASVAASVASSSLAGLAAPLLAQDVTPAPTTPPSCLSDAFCDFVFQRTGLAWLAEGGYYLLVKPVRIVLIILVALIVRFVINRMVAKLTKRATAGRPIVPRAMSDRIADSHHHDTARTERRRQRAQALGS